MHGSTEVKKRKRENLRGREEAGENWQVVLRQSEHFLARRHGIGHCVSGGLLPRDIYEADLSLL